MPIRLSYVMFADSIYSGIKYFHCEIMMTVIFSLCGQETFIGDSLIVYIGPFMI